MDPSGAADYIREDNLFSHRGSQTKRLFHAPRHLVPKITEKVPGKKRKRKGGKKEPSKHTALTERNAV